MRRSWGWGRFISGWASPGVKSLDMKMHKTFAPAVAVVMFAASIHAQVPDGKQGATNPAASAVIVEQPSAEASETITNVSGSNVVAVEWRSQATCGKDAIVVFGHEVEIKAGETADDVVVIGGSTKIKRRGRKAVGEG